MIPQRMVMSGRKVVVTPTRSLDFESSSSQDLRMSGTNFGTLNSRKWTYHVWFKRESTGNHFIVHKFDGPGFVQPVNFLFDASNHLDIRVRDNAPAIIGRLVTTASYTDTNWHQMVIYWDTANATSADRLQLYVDQSRETSFATNTQPSLNADMYDTTAATLYVGVNGGVANYYDGLLYQQAFFDNALPAISMLHSGGSPVDLRGMSGLYSLLHTTDSSTLEDDEVISTNWTNTNGVVKSTTVP